MRKFTFHCIGMLLTYQLFLVHLWYIILCGGGKVSNYMHFSRYPNKMPEVSSFEIFASQNIPQYVWFPSIFNIYKRYTKSIWRDIYLIRYQIYVDSKFTVHIFFRYLEISHIYLLHIPRDTFPHWVSISFLWAVFHFCSFLYILR